MNPQERVVPKAGYFPLSVIKLTTNSSPPNHIPSTCTTKWWNPPLLLIVPWAFSLPSMDSNTGWKGILLDGISRNL